MKEKFAYSALCQMTPERVNSLMIELREEYAELLKKHHQDCASILFYQAEIEKITRKGNE